MTRGSKAGEAEMDKTSEKTANKAKTIEVKMDASGRICIPKDIRKQLGLTPGVKITIEADARGDTIVLRPSREMPRLVNKDGVLIHRWDVFDDWLDEKFDEYKWLRDEDDEVRALTDMYGEIIDPEKDPIKFDREVRDTKISGRFGYH